MLVSGRTGEGIDAWREWLAAVPAPPPPPRRRRRRLRWERRPPPGYRDGSKPCLPPALMPTELLRRRGGPARALLSSDGGALRARRAADRRRLEPGGALGRAPRCGRVRAPGHRGQAGTACDRARSRGWATCGTAGAAGESDDIVLGFGADEVDGEAAAALAAAIHRGCMTLAFAPVGAEWELNRRPRTRSFAKSLSRRLSMCSGAGARLLRPPRPAERPRGADGP